MYIVHEGNNLIKLRFFESELKSESRSRGVGVVLLVNIGIGVGVVLFSSDSTALVESKNIDVLTSKKLREKYRSIDGGLSIMNSMSISMFF